MDSQDNRQSEYLCNYHFFPNSIEFRIISSHALEKWKNVQSFQLNQLVNGRFFFPQDRREILLLKYDLWSRWLVEVENMFIELHEKHSNIRQTDIDNIINLADKTAEVYEHIICTEHAHHFTEEFTKIWIKTHQQAYKFFIDDVCKSHGSYEDVFTRIVDVLCEVLQYTLTEIHELNEIFNDPESEEIFMVVSDFCLRFFKETGHCIIAERANIYKKHFPFTKIWFKNYTDQNLPRELVAAVEDAGYEINYKRTVFN